MITIRAISDFLEQFAPPRLAAEWDNVGLLVGDESVEVKKVMTCLTVTPASAAEAIEDGASLIVAHHPLPFRPIQQLTTETVAGSMLLDLIAARIAIYSPHTAFDSAAAGINQRLAQGLGLEDIEPLVVKEDEPDGLGSGRFGELPTAKPLLDVCGDLKALLSVEQLKAVGEPDRSVKTIAVACGSAGQYLDAAREAECDLLVTGETSFHTCLEAEATNVALLLPGHYASERFAIEQLAEVLANNFAGVDVWASRREADPLRLM